MRNLYCGRSWILHWFPRLFYFLSPRQRQTAHSHSLLFFCLIYVQIQQCFNFPSKWSERSLVGKSPSDSQKSWLSAIAASRTWDALLWWRGCWTPTALSHQWDFKNSSLPLTKTSMNVLKQMTIVKILLRLCEDTPINVKMVNGRDFI